MEESESPLVHSVGQTRWHSENHDAVDPASGLPTMTQGDGCYFSVLRLSKERPCNTLNGKT